MGSIGLAGCVAGSVARCVVDTVAGRAERAERAEPYGSGHGGQGN